MHTGNLKQRDFNKPKFGAHEASIESSAIDRAEATARVPRRNLQRD